jgi:two-component system chemotaxis sensor kinase CheA
MDELLSDFLTETAEYIDAASSQLVLFEKNPDDKTIIAGIFRLLHTIKGTCGFLGLTRLSVLTHSAEALISRLREGAPGTPQTVTLILEAVDRVRFILKELEETAQEPQGDDADLIQALETQIACTFVETRET